MATITSTRINDINCNNHNDDSNQDNDDSDIIASATGGAMIMPHALGSQLAAQTKRKEKARIAARARRSQEASIIMEMANELHITQEKIRRIDKATIVKLAIDYIKAFEILCRFHGDCFSTTNNITTTSTSSVNNTGSNNLNANNINNIININEVIRQSGDVSCKNNNRACSRSIDSDNSVDVTNCSSNGDSNSSNDNELHNDFILTQEISHNNNSKLLNNSQEMYPDKNNIKTLPLAVRNKNISIKDNVAQNSGNVHCISCQCSARCNTENINGNISISSDTSCFRQPVYATTASNSIVYVSLAQALPSTTSTTTTTTTTVATMTPPTMTTRTTTTIRSSMSYSPPPPRHQYTTATSAVAPTRPIDIVHHRSQLPRQPPSANHRQHSAHQQQSQPQLVAGGGQAGRRRSYVSVLREQQQREQEQPAPVQRYPAPKISTNSIFAPKTDDMDSYFLMISDERDGRPAFVLKPDSEILEEDDLTHLAPQAGDVSISLEVEPLDGIMIDTGIFLGGGGTSSSPPTKKAPPLVF